MMKEGREEAFRQLVCKKKNKPRGSSRKLGCLETKSVTVIKKSLFRVDINVRVGRGAAHIHVHVIHNHTQPRENALCYI